MQYEIIGKLKQGDKVYVRESTGNWAKIETEDDATAFVSKKAIKAAKTNDTLALLILFGALLTILYILLKKLKKGFKSRCKQCKKWGAVHEHSKELIYTKDSTIVKITETRNSQGKVTSSKENLVPATTYKYKVIKICTYCKNKTGYIYSEKLEN